LIYNLFNFFYS